MAKVPKDMGSGGAHLTPASSDPNLKQLLNAVTRDILTLKGAVDVINTTAALGLTIPDMVSEMSDDTTEEVGVTS